MADLQSTNRVSIAKVREATFGVTPANPAFKALRETSSSLAFNPQTVETNEIRSDRQVTDLILVGQQAGGDIGGEMSFRSMDDDLEEAVQSTWSNNPYIEVLTLDTEISDVSATTLTVLTPLGTPFKTGMLALTQGFVNAANNGIISRVVSSTATSIVFGAATFTAESAIPVGANVRSVGFMGAVGDLVATITSGNGLTSTLLDFTTLGLHVGQWIKLGGAATNTFFGTAALNDFCRVSAIAVNRLSFDVVPTGWAADSGAGKTIQVFVGDWITNSSTKRSNTIERQYLDHSPVSYEYLTGMTLDRLSFSAPAQQIATYTRTFVGAGGSIASARLAGATDIPAPTNNVLNTSANVGRIGYNGAPVATPNYVMTATWEFNNNIRRQNAVGSIAAVGTGNGEFGVTGTLEIYFGSKSILDAVLANTRVSFDIRLGRTDGNKETLLFDFPTIKFASGSPTVSGKNADVMLNANFTAIMDSVKGYTASISRFWFFP